MEKKPRWKCRIPAELRKEIIEVVKKHKSYRRVYSEWGRMKFDYCFSTNAATDDLLIQELLQFPVVREVKFYQTNTHHCSGGSHYALMITTTF